MLEKFIKLNLKNKITASLGGFMMVFLLLIYFVVVPTINDIKTMGKEIEEQRLDLEKKYIKGQSFRQLNENLKTIEPKLDLLDQIFINKNRELEFVTTLENKANKNKISQKINLGEPRATDNENFKKINIQLATTGDFSGQLKYLLDLESLNYYINMKSLEFYPSGGGKEQGNNQSNDANNNQNNDINLIINADTYWKQN